MMRLQWHLHRLRLALGTTGLAGLALLLAAAAAYFLLLQPDLREISSLKAELTAMKAQPHADRQHDAATELALFYDFFPERASLAEQLRTIYGQAGGDGMMPSRADYKLSKISGTPLWRYQISLPLEADYASLRQYLAAVLEALPNSALENIELQRADAKDEIVDAKVRLTLYFREAP